MLKDKLEFKFDYGNIFRCIASYIIEILENTALIVVIGVVFFSAMLIVTENMSDSTIKKAILITLLVIMITAILIFGCIIFLPKKVVLSDNYIDIRRWCVPTQIYFYDIRGLNDRIYYSQIILCDEYKDKVPFGSVVPFYYYNKESIVKIKTHSKIYYLPLKDYASFIEEVNKKAC